MTIEEIIKKVSKAKDGFKPIVIEANEYIASHSQKESLQLAKELYASPVYQARMMATHIFGIQSIVRLGAETIRM